MLQALFAGCFGLSGGGMGALEESPREGSAANICSSDLLGALLL